MNKKLITLLVLTVVGTLTIVTIIHLLPTIKKMTPLSQKITTQTAVPPQQPIITQDISTQDQLETALASKRPMVFKFYAGWCGACTYVNSYYAELKEDLPDIDFYSINIDNQEIMQQVESKKLSKEGIVYLPTFLMIQSGKETKQLTGAKKKDDMIAEIKKAFAA